MSKPMLIGICSAGFICMATPASAQISSGTDYKRISVTREPTNWAFGVNLAAADVKRLDNNVFSFGVFGNYFTSPDFALGLTLDYWNDSFLDADRRIEVNDLVLGGNARFHFPTMGPGLRPFALAGLAAHRFKVDVAERNPNADPLLDRFEKYNRSTKDVEGEIGADFGAGVLYRVQTSIDMLAEVRYRRILDRTVDLDQMNYAVALSYVL